MSENDYEQLREQKLKQLRDQATKQQGAREKEFQAEMQIDDALRIILTSEAKTRLSNVKLVNKEMYLKVSRLLLYLYKNGQIQGKITDKQMKEALAKMTEKREIKIKRR